MNIDEKIKIYDKDSIEYFKECKYKKVIMNGVFDDLQELKLKLIALYNEKILYLDYFASEAKYHGWDVNSQEFKNMVNLIDDIKTMFLKIYILTEIGTGQKIYIDK